MDARKTSNSYISISNNVISKIRSELVASGELKELSDLTKIHAAWKMKMIQAGVIRGTIDTLSASFPSSVTAPLQTQNPNPSPIEIDAQLPSKDHIMSIKNEHEIPQEDGDSDGFYIPQLDGVPVTNTNTNAPNEVKDDEILDEDDDDPEDDGDIDKKDFPHLIMCQFDYVKKRKKKKVNIWECKLVAGVMQINDKHILFSEAKGDFTF